MTAGGELYLYADGHSAVLSSQWPSPCTRNTSRGLRIGSSAAELLRLYPNAERHGNSYWLSVRSAPWMRGPKKDRHLGLLVAGVANGVVRDLDLNLQAQGE